MDVLRLDFVTDVGPLLSSDNPPWFTTPGSNRCRQRVRGMPVWACGTAEPSGKYVVGIHGGAYVVEPNIFEWIGCASWASRHRRHRIMPIYPLAPQGYRRHCHPGRRRPDLPRVDSARRRERQRRRATRPEAVSSSTAVQELVRRGDPVPSHMVPCHRRSISRSVSGDPVRRRPDPDRHNTAKGSAMGR